MTRKSQKPPRPTAPSTILAFGESRTDTEAIATLAHGLRPDLPRPSPRIKPVILSRQATKNKRDTIAEEIARLTKAEIAAGRSVRAILAHRDLDQPEIDETVDCQNLKGSSGHAKALASEISAALEGVGTPIRAVAVVAALETEAWWLLWPDAVAAHRRGWRRLPDRKGERVDRISNVKKVLQRELRPTAKGNHIPEYSESDGPLIAKKIVELQLTRSPRGTSVAYLRFVRDIDLI